MTTFKFVYRLSEEAQQRILIATGKKPNWQQKVSVDMVDLTPDQRQDVLYINPSQYSYRIDLSDQCLQIIKSRPVLLDNALNWKRWLTCDTAVKYEHVLSMEELVSEISAYAAKLRKMEPLACAKVAEVKTEREAEEARHAEMVTRQNAILEQADAIEDDETALRELFRSGDSEIWDYKRNFNDKTLAHRFFVVYLKPFEEARAEAKKAAAEAEQADWIEEYGSERLKLAAKHGHRLDRIYALERAAAEWPDFELDFYDKARWDERGNPSLSELKALEAITAKTDLPAMLVWLETPGRSQPQDDRYWESDCSDFEPGAALVIRQYLGEHDLIKTI